MCDIVVRTISADGNLFVCLFLILINHMCELLEPKVEYEDGGPYFDCGRYVNETPKNKYKRCCD